MTNEKITQFYEMFNTGDTSNITSILSPNWKNHPTEAADKSDIQGFIDNIILIRNAFENFKLEIIKTISEEDNVVVHIRMSGIHSKSYAGIEPSHKFVEFYGIDRHQLVSNQIRDTWHFEDYSNLYQNV